MAIRLNPVLPLTVYLGLLTLIPSTLVFEPLGGIGTPAMVLSLLILLWYLGSWIIGGMPSVSGGRPVRIAMFIYGLAVLASFVAAMTRNVSELEVLAADRGLITIIAWGGLIVVVAGTITRYHDLEKLMRRAVLFGSIIGALEIFEYYTGINVAYYIHIPGLSSSVGLSGVLDRNGLNRPASTATQPIELSVVMAMLLPFAIQQALDPTRRGRLRKLLPICLLIGAIAMALSRSGIVGAAVALLVLVPTWSARRQLNFVAAAAVGLGVLKAAAPGLLGTIGTYFAGLTGSSDSDISISTRTADYAAAATYIEQRPIFGRGFETFLPQLYRFIDNTYLMSIIETGFVGLITLLGVYLAGIHCAAIGRRHAQNQREREFGQAVVASIAVVLVASATFDAESFPMLTGLFFLVLGVAGSYHSIMTSRDWLTAEFHTAFVSVA
jgi:polysaccharide biosynthesis protein PslJ